MRLAWLSIAAACGGSSAAIPEPHAPVATTKIEGKRTEALDPIAVLASPPDTRSWIVPGVAQLELGAPTVKAPSGAAELEVTLLEEQQAMVRVAVHLDRLAFALWTERARLLGITTRDQLVTARPGGEYVPYAADPVAAQLHVGAHVRVLGHKEHWAEIRYLGALEIDGWIPDEALAFRTARTGGYRGRVPTGRMWLTLLPGAVIRSEAQWSARELAVIAYGYTVDKIAEVDNAWSEVGYEDGDVRVHGYVSTQAPPGRAHKPPEADTAPTQIAATATIPAGTCLYASEHGEAIGFVTAASPAELVASSHPGWYAAAFDTPWGPLAFAVQGPTDQELATCQPAPAP